MDRNAQEASGSRAPHESRLAGEVCLIEKLVHGGQGISTLADGRRAFVWNALPGEEVEITISKNKRSHAEAVATNIITPSKYRIEPRDEAYLSTSPWQIMTFVAENGYKKDILTETLQREHVNYDGDIALIADKDPWHYRNKMEYSFWADDQGLHLALFNRGTHGKRIVPGSSIAMPVVDETAHKVLAVLNKNGIRGSQLKTVVVRCNQQGVTVAALFVKDESFPDIAELAAVAKGVAVNYSTPKSPASVLTSELYRYGDITLHDDINGHDISYDVNSFFQVNVPVFNEALQIIGQEIGEQPYVDMYSGVGTIGISLGGAATLVESDAHNCEMARLNAAGTPAEVVQATAETALDYIVNDKILVVDPPRAGLHAKVTDRILEAKPSKVVYLSCNPITQARDLAKLQDNYIITSVTGYNFFPLTPHIESLAVLEKK